MSDGLVLNTGLESAPAADRSDTVAWEWLVEPVERFAYPFRLIPLALRLREAGLRPPSCAGVLGYDGTGLLGFGGRLVRIQAMPLVRRWEAELRALFDEALCWLPSLEEAARWLTVAGIPPSKVWRALPAESMANEAVVLEIFLMAMLRDLQGTDVPSIH